MEIPSFSWEDPSWLPAYRHCRFHVFLLHGPAAYHPSNSGWMQSCWWALAPTTSREKNAPPAAMSMWSCDRWFRPWKKFQNDKTFFHAVVWACCNVLLKMFPGFQDCFVLELLKTGNPVLKGVDFAHQKVLDQKSIGTRIPSVESFLVGVEPRLCFPKQREWEQTKMNIVRRESNGSWHYYYESTWAWWTTRYGQGCHHLAPTTMVSWGGTHFLANTKLGHHIRTRY